MSLLALFVWGVCSSLDPGSHPDHPAVCGGLGDRDDWLVAGCSAPSTVAVSTHLELVLNGADVPGSERGRGRNHTRDERGHGDHG